MKNKKLTYILIPLVLALWGTIIYRIFHTANNNSSLIKEDIGLLTNTNPKHTISDTFSIHPDYSDPFLRKKAGNTHIAKSAPQANTHQVSSLKITKPINDLPISSSWPNVVYNGLVRNQKSNKQLAMVQVNGQANIMQVGDIISEIKLLKITKDSVEIAFHNSKRTIKK